MASYVKFMSNASGAPKVVDEIHLKDGKATYDGSDEFLKSIIDHEVPGFDGTMHTADEGYAFLEALVAQFGGGMFYALMDDDDDPPDSSELEEDEDED